MTMTVLQPAALAAVVALGATAAVASEKQEPCMLPPQLEALWPPKDEVRFRPTTLEERELFGQLIPQLARGARTGGDPSAELVELAFRAGFALERWSAGGETFWSLTERREARRGAGAYVFRTGAAVEWVLQAPHAYFDLGTGAIGAQLFLCAPQAHRPRAFFTNTAHRFKGRPGERRGDPDHPADVAHNPEHLFQVATDLLARSVPGLRVVQLHGFGDSDRDDRRELNAVVSGGTDDPAPWMRTVATRVGQALGEGVQLYPDQTSVLGGTQNAQGRLLRAYPNTRFVHLELSSGVRRALRSRSGLEALAAALFGTEEE